MSPSTLARAAFAVGLLTSTVSAAFDINSKSNVAVYWGQSPNGNLKLSQLCANPNVDIVNIAFVTDFPTKVGEYPTTNHGNACWGTFDYPDGSSSHLLKNCNGMEQDIKDCQAAGKKVLLSLGGGATPDYYLKDKAVAEWFAEFLIGAYGPVTKEWTDKGLPRPIGSAVLDGFDLDLEAEEQYVYPADLIYKNYDYFGQYLKAWAPQMLLTGAPQCVVRDTRLWYALTKVPFDMLFVQFYNTDACSARQGYKDVKKATTTFTFDTWAAWLLANAANGSNVKLFLGLPAGPSAISATYASHYLLPEEANALITKYKTHKMFGGVMLWEDQISHDNIKFCKPYDYWMKQSLENTFLKNYQQSACVVSSSVLPSSTKVSSSQIPSSTKVSSTLVSSTKVSSSAIISSTKISSSAMISSTKISSSVHVSSTPVSSKASSSAYIVSSSTVKSSSTIYPVSSSAVSSSAHVVSSVVSSSSIYHVSSTIISSVHSASSSAVLSSSIYIESHVVSSSVYVESPIVSSSVYVETPVASASEYSVGVSSSAEIVSVSKDSYPTASLSEGHPISTPYLSAAEPTPYPSAAESSYYGEVPAPSASSSAYYQETTPEAASSTPCSSTTPYHSVAESSSYGEVPSASPSVYYPEVPESTPEAAVSTPYSTSSQYYVAESSYYGVPASSVYEVYPQETPEASSKGEVYSTGKGYDNVPSVTKSAEYPSKPSDATTAVVTTTYVDVCSTGLTTKTTTIVKTVCNSCAKPTHYPEEVPEGWTTSVYVSKTLTVTITKPAHPATYVPAYPSATPEVPVHKEEYPEKPTQPEYPTVAVSSKAQEYPAHSSVPEYPQKPAQPEYPAHSAVSEYPQKPVEHATEPYAQNTLTKVPVAVYTPAPYPSAPYVPVPAKNNTTAYVPLPTGTGKPTKPSSYSPTEFEGAAGRVGAGLTAVVAVVIAFLVL